MSATPVKIDVPDLEFRCPDCPMCGAETSAVDDCFDCEDCNLSWSKDGTRGERGDPYSPLCTVERSPHANQARYPNIRGYRYRCIRDEDHELPHRGTRVDEPHPYDTHEWSDADPVAAVSA